MRCPIIIVNQEFACDFVFIVLMLSGSVTMFVKCRDVMVKHNKLKLG